MRTAKTLIRLGGCPGWSESSLGTHSFCWFCHVTAQVCFWFKIWFSVSRMFWTKDWSQLWKMYYHKTPKLWTPKQIAVVILKLSFYYRIMGQKHAVGIANSVDPDKTAWSSLIWVYTVCPGLSVQKLRIITVLVTCLIPFLNKTYQVLLYIILH